MLCTQPGLPIRFYNTARFLSFPNLMVVAVMRAVPRGVGARQCRGARVHAAGGRAARRARPARANGVQALGA